MAICEFLHCSFSELPKRCPTIIDRLTVIQYIQEKNSREERAMSMAGGKKPSVPRKPKR